MPSFTRAFIALLAVASVSLSVLAAPIPEVGALALAIRSPSSKMSTPALDLRSDDDFSDLEIRDFSDEDITLGMRSFVDDMSPMERRSWFKKAFNKAKATFNRAKGAINSVRPALGPASDVMNAAAGVAGKFGGKRGKALSRGLNTANRGIKYGSQFGLRSIEGDGSLAARDVDEELDVRDMSDDDILLAIRSTWEEMTPVERRGWFKKALNKAKSVGRTVKHTLGPASKYINTGAQLAGAFGGPRGKALSKGLYSANRAIGTANHAIGTANRAIGTANAVGSQFGLRSVEDEEIDARDEEVEDEME